MSSTGVSNGITSSSLVYWGAGGLAAASHLGRLPGRAGAAALSPGAAGAVAPGPKPLRSGRPDAQLRRDAAERAKMNQIWKCLKQ